MVVFSTIRCNMTHEIGFVDDPRQSDIMWMRAKKLGPIIIGNRTTMTGMNVLWKRSSVAVVCGGDTSSCGSRVKGRT